MGLIVLTSQHCLQHLMRLTNRKPLKPQLTHSEQVLDKIGELIKPSASSALSGKSRKAAPGIFYNLRLDMGDKEPWDHFGQSLWTRLYSKGLSCGVHILW